jgi:hypothetical protein
MGCCFSLFFFSFSPLKAAATPIKIEAVCGNKYNPSLSLYTTPTHPARAREPRPRPFPIVREAPEQEEEEEEIHKRAEKEKEIKNKKKGEIREETCVRVTIG